MRVISKSRLKHFWELVGYDDAEGPLRAWYTHVSHRKVRWLTWGDVKASFASASIFGDCIVFNVGGNKYRLICRVRYTTQKVFVLKVMTHNEYDKGKWKHECGCMEPPPSSSEKVERPPRSSKGNRS